MSSRKTAISDQEVCGGKRVERSRKVEVVYGPRAACVDEQTAPFFGRRVGLDKVGVCVCVKGVEGFQQWVSDVKDSVEDSDWAVNTQGYFGQNGAEIMNERVLKLDRTLRTETMWKLHTRNRDSGVPRVLDGVVGRRRFGVDQIDRLCECDDFVHSGYDKAEFVESRVCRLLFFLINYSSGIVLIAFCAAVAGHKSTVLCFFAICKCLTMNKTVEWSVIYTKMW